MTRTHTSGELNAQHIGEEVQLIGWVQKRRDLGGLIFVDVRDRTGLVQVVFNPELSEEAIQIADKLRNEYIIEVHGKVIERAANQVNPNIASGAIEVHASKVVIINEAKNPPFAIENETEAGEDVRLKYRYLDLRRPVMYDTFKMRSDITKTVRRFLDDEGFLEVETPILNEIYARRSS